MKQIAADEAELRIKTFLEAADLDDLASMMSRYIEDGPLMVFDDQGESDTFENGERVVESPSTLRIKARVYSDDHKATADFDATLWFERFESRDILTLANEGWGADYEADQVAMFMADHNEQVAEVFKHRERMSTPGNTMGFECHIDIDSAMAWLDENMPDTAKLIREDGTIETEGSLQHFSHAVNGDHQET